MSFTSCHFSFHLAVFCLGCRIGVALVYVIIAYQLLPFPFLLLNITVDMDFPQETFVITLVIYGHNGHKLVTTSYHPLIRLYWDMLRKLYVVKGFFPALTYSTVHPIRHQTAIHVVFFQSWESLIDLW